MTYALTPVSADGSGDDWPILQAILDTAPNGSTIVLGPGTYNVRADRLSVLGKRGLRIVGEGLPTIRYRSALDVVGPAAVTRAGIYAESCEDFRAEGLRWEGDISPDLALNLGAAVYLRGSRNATLRDLHLAGGASLFQQDPLAEDRGLHVTRCHSYGHRQPCIPGPGTRVENCEWEQPTDASYDRLGSLGSSHAIYLYAGRDDVTVEGCTFRNVRTHGVKASGTALPILRTTVRNSTFVDCGGGVLVGADGATHPDHDDARIEGNRFIDCANRGVGSGWFTGATITILGSRGVRVAGNTLLYTRASITPAATKGIEAQRYYTGSVGGRLCEDLVIADNILVSRAPGVYPGNVLTHGIYLYEVARARVERNAIYDCSSVGVTAMNGCSGLEVCGQRFHNIISALQAWNATGIEVVGSRMFRGANTSNNAQLRLYGCTGGVASDNEEVTAAGQVPMSELWG